MWSRIVLRTSTLVERPTSSDDEVVGVGANVHEAPQHVRERTDSDLLRQRALALEAAPEVEQLAVALLLTRAQCLINLWVLPSGHRESLVNPPHLRGPAP
jgi:hypothetical protein